MYTNKQRQWDVKLLRYNNTINKWVVIDSKKVWEFDDECYKANVFYQALNVFENEIQVNDVIFSCDTYTQITPNTYKIINTIYYSDVIW